MWSELVTPRREGAKKPQQIDPRSTLAFSRDRPCETVSAHRLCAFAPLRDSMTAIDSLFLRASSMPDRHTARRRVLTGQS
jgi:hypothetical protein